MRWSSSLRIEDFLDAPMPETKARKSTMLPHQPDTLGEKVCSSKILTPAISMKLMALDELDARFVARSGETVVGRGSRIREVIAGLTCLKTKFKSRVLQATTIHDVALLYTDFQGIYLYASGKTIEVRSKAVEVLRRQPDGAWKLIVGDPNGPRTRSRHEHDVKKSGRRLPRLADRSAGCSHLACRDSCP